MLSSIYDFAIRLNRLEQLFQIPMGKSITKPYNPLRFWWSNCYFG